MKQVRNSFLPVAQLFSMSALLLAGTACLAQSGPDAEQLAKANACMACHAVREKVVGPAYAEIAKRYAGKSEALQELADSIKKGGSGKWGNIPMPANSQLSDDEAKVLAKWVLERK